MLERIDPNVQFDFGVESPVAGKLEAHEFVIRWTGSVLAPETGEYEFLVRTEHAPGSGINDSKKPLIDACVKSGQGYSNTVPRSFSPAVGPIRSSSST